GAAATDETRCYDVTKPESFVIKVLARTLILLTWIQAFLFIPNYGTAVSVTLPFLVGASLSEGGIKP
uniref:hypothetical protein n=1 Tax=Pontibacterium sp. TaxID=2036026 RepID=UPI0035123AA9